MKTLEDIIGSDAARNRILEARIEALEGVIGDRDKRIARLEEENARLAAYIEADRNLLRAG